MHQVTSTPAPAAPVISADRFVTWVCTICRLAGIPVLAAFVDGRPVYACASCGSHNVTPPASPTGCPSWCDPEHAHRAPVDVEHESALRPLASASLAEGDAYADVDAVIYQNPGEPVRVALGIATHLGDATAELTPEELLQVAYGLINIAVTARAAGSR